LTAVLAELDKRGLGGLYKSGRVKHCARGEIVILEGDPLEGYYILLKGAVKVYKQTREGKTVTLATWPAIGTLGDMSLIDRQEAGASVQALTDVDVLVIDCDIILRHMEKRPEVATVLMRGIVERLRFLQNRLLEIVSEPVDKRLVKILLSLSAQFGQEVPLTHQDIADLAGVCRELVSKKLHQLQGTGVLVAKRGRVIILDEPRLRKMISDDPGRSGC